MKYLESAENPLIKAAIKLHTAKGREQQQRFIAEGSRTCKTLLKTAPLLELYVTENHIDFAQDIGFEHVIVLPATLMNKISTSATPAGILGVFQIPKQQELQSITSGLVLAAISDPGNMGTLLRTAAAMNIKTIIVIDGVDVWSPKVIQASAGCIAQLNIFCLSWNELVAFKNRPILSALVVSGGTAPEKLSPTDRLLIVGNEAHGIPEQWLKECDEKITLPMPGGTESLNAAIAGSIALYMLFNK